MSNKAKTQEVIAILNDWFAPEIVGGVEISSAELAHQLNKLQYSVTVYTPHQPNLLGKYLIDGINVNFVGGLHLRKENRTNLAIQVFEKIRVWLDLFTPFYLLLQIKKTSPKFLLIHNIDRYGPWLLIIAKIFFSSDQLIRIYHDLSDTCVIRSRFRFSKVCFNPCKLCIPKSTILAQLSKICGKNFANSKFIARELGRLGFAIDDTAIGNSVAYGIEKVIVYPLRELRHSLGYVGRITRLKGVETILRGAAIANPHWQVHLIGPVKDNYRIKLEKLGEKLQVEVKIHRPTHTPFDVLAPLVDCVVVASESLEAFGRVPIEATLAEIPVISTEIGGLAEALDYMSPRPNTFTAGDPNSLAKQLNEFTQPQSVSIGFNSQVTLNDIVISHIMGKT